jgi:hypothetical protein
MIEKTDQELVDELVGMCYIYGPNSGCVIEFVNIHKYRPGWWKLAIDKVTVVCRPEVPHWGYPPYDVNPVLAFIIMGIAVLIIFLFAIFVSV